MLYGFDDADDALTSVPTAGQRALDHAGRKLSLEGWQSLSVEDRLELVELGATSVVNVAAVDAVVSRAEPPPKPLARMPDPHPARPAPSLVEALAALGFALDEVRWRALRPIERYALAHAAQKPERLPRVAAEILGR
jgi:hypothetical protein